MARKRAHRRAVPPMGDMFAVGGCDCTCGGCTGCSACSGSIPCTLYITDINGTFPAPWSASNTWWATGFLCSPTTASPTAMCSAGPALTCQAIATAGRAIYGYTINCGSAGLMTITRYWFENACGIGPSPQYWPCACESILAPYPNAYSKIARASSVSITCGSISWSGTLPKITGSLADPAAGTTSFSQ